MRTETGTVREHYRGYERWLAAHDKVPADQQLDAHRAQGAEVSLSV